MSKASIYPEDVSGVLSSNSTQQSPCSPFSEEQLENLSLESNYLSTLKRGIELEYFGLFVQLMDEYQKYIESHLLIEDASHKRFVISRGIQTLHHIFNYLLLYTKNIHLVVYHIQKAIFIYVEFNGRIKLDEAVYLKISSNDSIMFLYKKTIYALKKEFQLKHSLSNDERETLGELHLYTNRFVNLLIDTINMSPLEYFMNKNMNMNANIIKKICPIQLIIQSFKMVLISLNATRSQKIIWLHRVCHTIESKYDLIQQWKEIYLMLISASHTELLSQYSSTRILNQLMNILICP